MGKKKEDDTATEENWMVTYLMGLLNVRSSRYKTEMVYLFPHKRGNKHPYFLDPNKPSLYNEDWKYYNPAGRVYRNYLTYAWYLLTKYGWSVALFLLLCADGIIFGSFVDIKAELGFNGELCAHDASKVDYYIEYFKNYTGYYDSLAMANYTTIVSNRFWNATRDRYYYSETTNTSWPQPYMPEGSNSTTTITVEETDCGYEEKFCYDNFITKKILKWFCAKVDIPCTNVFTTIDNYYYWSEADDFEYLGDQNYNATAQVNSLAASALDAIYARLLFASSMYCIYLAFMIFLGSPYELSSPRFMTKIKIKLGLFGKLWFITVFVIMWYLIEVLYHFFEEMVLDTDLWLIFQYFVTDPCFGDSGFLGDLYAQAEQVCSNQLAAKNKYNVLTYNMDYWANVEQTYYDNFEPEFYWKISTWSGSGAASVTCSMRLSGYFGGYCPAAYTKKNENPSSTCINYWNTNKKSDAGTDYYTSSSYTGTAYQSCTFNEDQFGYNYLCKCAYDGASYTDFIIYPWNETQVDKGIYWSANWTCDIDQFMSTIQPKGSDDFSIGAFLYSSGYVAGLMFQPVVAGVFTGILTMLSPLCAYSDRVEWPYGLASFGNMDELEVQFARKSVEKFIRWNTILPLIVSCNMLMIILINMLTEDLEDLEKLYANHAATYWCGNIVLLFVLIGFTILATRKTKIKRKKSKKRK